MTRFAPSALYNRGGEGYNTPCPVAVRLPGARMNTLEGLMEKDVIISIKGTQKYDGGEPGAVELVTAGRLARDEAGYTLSYQESELTGLEGTLTTIQVEMCIRDRTHSLGQRQNRAAKISVIARLSSRLCPLGT